MGDHSGAELDVRVVEHLTVRGGANRNGFSLVADAAAGDQDNATPTAADVILIFFVMLYTAILAFSQVPETSGRRLVTCAGRQSEPMPRLVPRPAPVSTGRADQRCWVRSRRALPITLTDDSAMAAAAMMGESRSPKNG